MFIEKQQNQDIDSELDLASASESPSTIRRRSLRLSRAESNKRKQPPILELSAQRKKARRGEGKRAASPTHPAPNAPATPPPSTPDRPLFSVATRGNTIKAATLAQSPIRQSPISQSQSHAHALTLSSPSPASPLTTTTASTITNTDASLDELEKVSDNMASLSPLGHLPLATQFEQDYHQVESKLQTSIERSMTNAKALIQSLDHASETCHDMSVRVGDRIELLEHENSKLRSQYQTSCQTSSQMEASIKGLKLKMASLYRSLDEQNERGRELTELVLEKENQVVLYQNQVAELQHVVMIKETELEALEETVQRIQEASDMDLEEMTFDYDALLIHYEADMEKWTRLSKENTSCQQKAEAAREDERRAWQLEKSQLQTEFKQRIWDAELAFGDILKSVYIESHQVIQRLQHELHLVLDQLSDHVTFAYEDVLTQIDSELKAFAAAFLYDLQTQWTELERIMSQHYDASKECSLLKLTELKQAWLHRVQHFQDRLLIVGSTEKE